MFECLCVVCCMCICVSHPTASQSCGLNGDLIELSASYLQSMGALLHLSESIELRELVILSPEFLIEVMRGLVSLKHKCACCV